MAEVLTKPTIASGVKKPKIFGNPKQADLVIYRLTEKNPSGGQRIKDNSWIRSDTPLYPPYKRFPNYDIIRWNFGTENEPEWGERMIRFLPGFGSIFVDEQEKGGREIPDSVLNNPNSRFEIIDGLIKVRPHEKTKIQFLDYCNRNVDSPYRTGKIQGIFEKYSEEKAVQKKSENLSRQREAIGKAFKADERQIAFHAKYLGIALLDYVDGATRTFEAVKTDYEQFALDDPETFLNTFDDSDIRLRYYIEIAIEDGVINLKSKNNWAVWGATKEDICEIPSGTTATDALFNFSALKAGEHFRKRIQNEG